MNHKAKKYISTIVLIVLCLVCAAVFYVNASGIFGSKDDENGENPNDTNVSIDTDVPIEDLPKATIDSNGTILSEYMCDSNLRAEWVILKNEGSDMIYLSVELYFDGSKSILDDCDGFLLVNGQKKDFLSSDIDEKNLLCSITQKIQSTEDIEMSIDATLNINIEKENGVKLSQISLSGTVVASEKYKDMASAHSIPLKHISQFPDLPSGDEITSLSMVLSYLGYDIDKTELCDLYLEKGPVGFTDFNEANVGNPRNAYNSYGCLPPVIVKSATKFIGANGGNFKAYNYTGVDASELYYEVSQNNPIIVWACEDFDITPSISRIWIVDGKTLYLKSNMACMVLIGYDYEKNTVTLANPAGTVFDIDMDLFELRHKQMGAHSVIIK